MRGKRGESHPSTAGFGVGVTETGGIPEPASRPSPGKAPRGGWRKAAALPLDPGLAARSLEPSLWASKGSWSRAGAVGLGAPRPGHTASPSLPLIPLFLKAFPGSPRSGHRAFPRPLPSLLRNAPDFPGITAAVGIK